MAVTKRLRKLNGKQNNFYHAEVYVRGERVADKTFETQAEAYVWHDDIKERFISGQPVHVKIEGFTFADCLKKYEDEQLPLLRKSTQQTHLLRYKYFRDSPLKFIQMRDFGAHTIDHWLGWMRQHPTSKNPARKTFRAELKLLSAILQWYRNYCNHSFVVPIVKRHHERCRYKPITSRRPDYYIRPEEIRKWLDYLENRRGRFIFYQLAKFMILTGVRVGEAAGLHWDAVNLIEGTARIIRTASWDHFTREPYIQELAKNEESIRVVKLTPELVEMFREMKSNAIETQPVFHTEDGGLLRDSKIRQVFTKAFKECGLPRTATRITRHTWATLGLIANDGNISAIQAGMGHRSRKVTEHYAKVVAALNSETVNRTSELMGLSQNHVQNHVLAKVAK